MKRSLLRLFLSGLFCCSFLVSAETQNNHAQYLSLIQQSNAFIEQFLPINYDFKQNQDPSKYSLKSFLTMKIDGELFDHVTDEAGTFQSLNNQTIVNSVMDFYLKYDLTEEAVTIPLLKGAVHQATIDHDNKTYRSTILYKGVNTSSQKAPIIDDKLIVISNDLGHLSLSSLKNSRFYRFDEDFKTIFASQNTFELNNFDMSVEAFTMAYDQFNLESDYKKLEKTFSLKGIVKEMKIASLLGSVIMPAFKIDLIINTEGERSSIQSEYWAQDILAAGGEGGKDFFPLGSVKYSSGMSHLENIAIDEYLKILANIFTTQLEEGSYQQLLPLVKQFFTSVTDQTEFGYKWELVSASGEKVMMTATAQLKDKNLLLNRLSSKMSFQVWVDNVKKLKFKLTVSENYLVQQYLQLTRIIKGLDDTSLDIEEKKMRALIDKNYLLIMRLSPKGTKLIVREQGHFNITVDYQNETWNVNGDSYSNDKLKELFDL